MKWNLKQKPSAATLYIAALIGVSGTISAAVINNRRPVVITNPIPPLEPDSSEDLAYEVTALIPGDERGLIDIVGKVSSWIQYLELMKDIEPRAAGALASISVRDWVTAAEQTAGLDVYTNESAQSNAFIGAAIVAYGKNRPGLVAELYQKAKMANKESSEPIVYQLIGAVRLGYSQVAIKDLLNDLIADQSLSPRDRFVVAYARSSLAVRDGEADQAASIMWGTFEIVDQEYQRSSTGSTLKDMVMARAVWLGLKLESSASKDWEAMSLVANVLTEFAPQMPRLNAGTASVYNTLSRYHRTSESKNPNYDLTLADYYADQATTVCPRGDGKCAGDTYNSQMRVLLVRSVKEDGSLDINVLFEAEHQGSLAVKAYQAVNALQDEAESRYNLCAIRAGIANALWISIDTKDRAEAWNQKALRTLNMPEDSFENLDDGLQYQMEKLRKDITVWPPRAK